ncbi:MAG: lytic transglycosylase domain-containing protein [Deltaproteobacteria bacterium]|nr:lytic transglycosylase domain-containing protein [Deltaproteobacteria bacterium]
MTRFNRIFIIKFLTIALVFSTAFVAGGHYLDNELMAQWDIRKEKQEAQCELNNIMEVLNEYYARKPLEFREELSSCIQRVCKENNLPPALLLAVIFTESSFRESVRSHRGAVGLMQLLPATGYALSKELRIEWKGHETLYDVSHNVRMGAYYLTKLLKRFNDLDTALTAYNAGPTRVVRYARKGITYSQTYAKKVSRNCEMFTNNYFRIES